MPRAVPRMRMSHIGICVSDWKRSLRFYHDVLGFRFVHEITVEGEPAETMLRLRDVELRALYLEREGVRIELLHYASPGHQPGPVPRPMNQLGLTHLALRVDDLEASLSAMREAGVSVHEETLVGEVGAPARAVFVADPDGTLIELAEQPGD